MKLTRVPRISNIRPGVAAVVALSLIILPLLIPSNAAGTAAPPSINLRSESQLRSEAARYERARSEISRILNIKLDSLADLKQAVAIFDREHEGLKFLLSEFFVIAIGDSTFNSALKRKVTDQKSAEAFGKELGRDPNSILNLGGAGALKTRLLQTASTDGAILRKVAERLKLAAEKLKRTSGSLNDTQSPNRLRPIPVSFSAPGPDREMTIPPAKTDLTAVVVTTLIVAAIFTPLGPAVVAGAVVLSGPISLAIVAGLAAYTVEKLIENYGNQHADAIANCEDAANARLQTCEASATGLLAPLIKAVCIAQWLLEVADCAFA